MPPRVVSLARMNEAKRNKTFSSLRARAPSANKEFYLLTIRTGSRTVENAHTGHWGRVRLPLVLRPMGYPTAEAN
jgi:hypothetical protein